MPDPAFLTASAVHRAAPGRYTLEVDPGWLQGPGAFGGLVAAWLVRAMEAELGDASRPLRVFTAELCAPAKPGPAEVEVRLLRTGLNVTFLAAELRRRERVMARASGTFGRARDGVVDQAPSFPACPPPEAVPTWYPPIDLPVYCQHLGYGRCLGEEVLSGPAAQATLGGWTRFREPVADDAAARVALLDSWPPALFVRLGAPRPVGTITMTCQLFGAATPPLAPGSPYLVTARSTATHEGYSEERGELWSPTGQLLATSQQVVAIY